MARLVPVEEKECHLSEARGWLDESDPFFDTIAHTVAEREKHVPRVLAESDHQ